MNHDLHDALEDIVYAWTIKGQTEERLIEDIYEYVLQTYGPPF